MKDILEISLKSLRANIIDLQDGKFLTAGQNQFQTLWTRDFCHSIKGLLAAGETAVAQSHMSYLLKSLRADGLVPRVLDNIPVQLRVLYQTGRKLLPVLPRIPFGNPLKPQYTDEHGSNAYDSNVLLVLGCLDLSSDFFKEHEEKILHAWKWYDDKFQNGLIYQKPFSDWQDTTRREGHTFLLNFFYFEAASELLKRGVDVNVDLQELKSNIKKVFWNGTLFRTLKDNEVISVEGNLFALLSQINFLQR